MVYTRLSGRARHPSRLEDAIAAPGFFSAYRAPAPQQLHSLNIGLEQAMEEVLSGRQAVELTGPSRQSWAGGARRGSGSSAPSWYASCPSTARSQERRLQCNPAPPRQGGPVCTRATDER